MTKQLQGPKVIPKIRRTSAGREPALSEVEGDLARIGLGPTALQLSLMYSPQLLDHFQNPRNAGTITRPDACAKVENPACGDILELSINISDGRISEIRFRAKGCVPAMACGSALTELVKGKTVDEARKVSREDVVLEVGGVPETSIHASHLAIDALTAALQGRGIESGK